MKKKKLVVFGILIAMLVPLLTSCSSNDYARITEVDYKAVVVDEPESEGKVVVTERLTFDIHAASANNLFWELWRDLCEDYIDGLKVHYKVNSVKQIYEDGTEVIYEESPKLYWDDYDYVSSNPFYGPGKWYHSEGPYDEDDAQYECVFFYVDGLYREKVVFEIEYEMYNAALRYNDCSDLYLALYSGETIQYLESFTAEILFPEKDMPSAGNYEAYTYGTNANSFPFEESATKNPGYYTFSFELDEDDLQFKPYNEYIEFDLIAYGDDKHIFTEYAPDNYYSYDDVLEEIYAEQEAYASAPELFKQIKTVVFIISAFIAAWVLFGGILKIKKLKKKHNFFTPECEYELYRDIPSDLDPNFASALVFCKDKAPKDDSNVYSAILLSLARKKYIDLTERADGNVLIMLKQTQTVTPVVSVDETMVVEEPIPCVETEQLEPLTQSEKHYLDMIKRHAKMDTGVDYIYMNELQNRIANDYEYTHSFTQHIKHAIVNIGISEGYFQKANYAEPRLQLTSSASTFMFFGVLLLTLVNIVCFTTRMDLAFGSFFILGGSFIIRALYQKALAKKYILLTQYGENEYQKWRGLYNFLKSDTLIHERTMIELPLWEKYLVYATAFGISQKVIDAIQIHCPQTTTDSIVNNNYCRSGRIRTSGRSMHSSIRSSSYSGGSGGGFGYGGGGRGGGGGGGGH